MKCFKVSSEGARKEGSDGIFYHIERAYLVESPEEAERQFRLQFETVRPVKVVEVEFKPRPVHFNSLWENLDDD